MRKHCGNCANHRDETNRFSEECGKCVATVLKNGEKSDPSHWKAKPQTNADRIRMMDDEQLAWELMTWRIEADAKHHGVESKYPNTQKTILEWLKQPAKEELDD